MKLSEIMTKDVSVIGPDASLTEAAKMMDDLNVGDLPVCDGSRLLGIITDRDIVIRSISAGQDPNSSKVRDSMTSPVIYCFEDSDVKEAAKLMKDKQIRRLPVLNKDKSLIGIVSLGDLAVEQPSKNLSGEVLKEVSEPAKPAA